MPDRGIPGSQVRWKGKDLPVSHSDLIRMTTLAYIVAGLGVFLLWRITGNLAWVVQFFRLPSAILLVALPAVQLWFSLQVCAQFSTG